jgi:hypothetical protein
MIGCAAPRPTGDAAVAPLAPTATLVAGVLRGLAADRELTFAAIGAAPAASSGSADSPARGALEARRGGALRWRADLPGAGGPLARTGELVIAATAARGGDLDVRGEPGALLTALDAKTGIPRWRLALHATGWVVVTALAPDDRGGVVAAGAFTGTLRAGAAVVSSGGGSDGFWARISAAGAVVDLGRMGGPGADAIQGAGARGDQLVLAGAFSPGADLRGMALDALDPRSSTPDAFVAALELDAGRPRWTAVLGGDGEDAVVGAAIDARGRIAVAAQLRGTARVHGRELRAEGDGDALVAWWDPHGAAGPVLRVGGSGPDSAAAIAASGDRVVLGVVFRGALRAGGLTLQSAGSDDAAAIALDGGAVSGVWHAAGPGREEVVALAGAPGGFAWAIAHTAGARVDADSIAPPADPLAGGAVIVRALP